MPLTLTRSLLVVLVPGIVAVAPWVLVGVKQWPNLAQTYAAYAALENAMLFAIVVVVGSLFEGLASHMEVRWDKERESELSIKENWYAYLRQTEPEPVGNRYISRMVTAMYFELTMLFASFLFFLGVAALMWLSDLQFWALIICAVAIIFAAYFRWQGRSSHKVLCEVRRGLAARGRVPSKESSPNKRPPEAPAS